MRMESTGNLFQLQFDERLSTFVVTLDNMTL